MSRECVQVAKPRPCNICGATDHRFTHLKIDSTSKSFHHFKTPLAILSHSSQCPCLSQYALFSLSLAGPSGKRLRQQAMAKRYVLALLSDRQVRPESDNWRFLATDASSATHHGSAVALRFFH